MKMDFLNPLNILAQKNQSEFRETLHESSTGLHCTWAQPSETQLPYYRYLQWDFNHDIPPFTCLLLKGILT